jgi:hypothetical protein
MTERYEIREIDDAFDVIDLEKGIWLASFLFFIDARKFAQEQVALTSAKGNSDEG